MSGSVLVGHVETGEAATMKLYLVQHSEACTKEVDLARPLTDPGEDDVDRLAALLGQPGVQVGRVIRRGGHR